ncbi:hypothetical protein [Jiangella mangrovi]|uniref:Uncharacterized protein n=1 Tax=Jiangella mangrovi TaxID=1524084 RepID=A0A7W9GRF8_9ACTN|nr:hypothetical protein [Jiangella mangrovi]MBB5788391.1 hypothetical protein [Jiangella mangrovi]
MGISVYTENQIHDRVYVGGESSEQLERLLDKAAENGLLADVGRVGDTMFNIPQLYRLDAELTALAESWPELAADVAVISAMIQRIIRNRGYLRLAGD